MAARKKKTAQDKEEDRLRSKLIDLEKANPALFEHPFSKYPIDTIIYRDIKFHMLTNRNLRQLKLVVAQNGDMILKINPRFTWRTIYGTVVEYYKWCNDHLKDSMEAYDNVTFLAQNKRTFKTNDIIFLWGLPYLLCVDENTETESVGFRRPKQIMPTLVPKGTSRYSDKVAMLCRSGYINKEALESLPIFNQGIMILPKHCLWDKIEAFDYDRAKEAVPGWDGSSSYRTVNPIMARDSALRTKTPHTGNYYLDAFAAMMQLTQDNLLSRRDYFGSRMLSAPERLILENVIKQFSDHTRAEDFDPETLNMIIGRSEMATAPYMKEVLKGCITNKSELYPKEPLLQYDFEAARKVDAKSSLSLDENFADRTGIRSDQPHARILESFSPKTLEFVSKARTLMIENKKVPTMMFYPDPKDYISMSRKELEQELKLQLDFYQTGRLGCYIKLATLTYQAPNALAHQELTEQTLAQSARPVNDNALPLEDLELTFMSTDGHEVEPSCALIGYLPDTPQSINVMDAMNPAVAQGQSTETWGAKIAGDILARRRNPPKVRHFSSTLVRPGTLRIGLTGAADPVKVKEQVDKFIRNSTVRLAINFLNNIRPQYIQAYNNTARHYRMDPIVWVGKVDVVKMKPLGQCRSRESNNPEVRLSPHLAMYPVNLLTAVIQHELCHLTMYNHSKIFHYMLSILCPESDRICNAMLTIYMRDT